MVRLQAQRSARVHMDALDLEPITHQKHKLFRIALARKRLQARARATRQDKLWF